MRTENCRAFTGVAACSKAISLPAAHSDVELIPFETEAGITPQEFGGWGGGMYVEPALKILFPDGNRDLVLHYVSYAITPEALTILLKDISRDVFVTLRYTVDPETNIIGRSAVIQNKTGSPLLVEQAAAGSFNLPVGTHYQLNYLTGRWASEFHLQQREITPGKIVLESRRGSTGHQNNPWFAIERSKSSDEDQGAVWFGALAWSGSWSITVEQDQMQRVHLTAGFNPFDFGYKLAPGKELTTPVLYGGFTDDGLGGASRLMHRFELRKFCLRHRDRRSVQFSTTHESTFSVDEAGQEALAEKAASIGVERFVMDDGWSKPAKQRPCRPSATAYVNPQKFPHGRFTHRQGPLPRHGLRPAEPEMSPTWTAICTASTPTGC